MMTINFNSYSISNNRRPNFTGRPNLPSDYTINSKRLTSALKWVHKNIASHHQRLILGATALTSQPFIDLHNKNVDERTRKVSCAKTLAKIISGTAVGFAVRYLCTKLAENYTEVKPNGLKASRRSFFAPSKMKNFTPDKRLQYINTVGSLMGVLACLVTNFAIDTPLTKYLTNVFSEKIVPENTEKGVNI